MRNLCAIIIPMLIGLVLTGSVFAQSPEKMSYQAVIRNSNNALVVNTQIGMQISILQGSTNGTAVYVETQQPTTNANGLVSIEIGMGVVISGSFSSIDWGNNLYFIKTETAVEVPLTNYTITGTSQLVSVPYALHAKTAESVTGFITETDPAVAANFDFDDASIGNVLQFNGTKWVSVTPNYITDYTVTEIDVTAHQQALVITESQISDLGTYIETETDPRVPTGTQSGQMQYWNGANWITIPVGNEGQVLTFTGGVPTWAGGTAPIIQNVTNPATGRIWMDRNLGASQVATSSTDTASYGDLYQWGRAADGHENSTSGTSFTLSSSDTPGHDNFIILSYGSSNIYDWLSPQNDNLWQGVNGINNPCPSGYRLPTQAEWEAERASWSSNDAEGAFNSPLKLSLTGYRYVENGEIIDNGHIAYYWSSSVDGIRSSFLNFAENFAGRSSYRRAFGLAVRCIKD